MSDLNIEIYDNKTFKDLCGDIIARSESKKQQIDSLLGIMRSHVKDETSALNFIPHIKSLLDTGIKNDEQLVKLATVFQRIQSSQIESGEEGAGLGLSEQDKEQLLREVEDIKLIVNAPVTSSISL